MKQRSLLDMLEEASRRPVPYEGLSIPDLGDAACLRAIFSDQANSDLYDARLRSEAGSISENSKNPLGPITKQVARPS